MSLTFSLAVDDMIGMLKNTLDPTNCKLFYEDTRDDLKTDLSPWAVVIVRHAGGLQSTLGGKNNRDFLRLGVLIITVNTPAGSGLSNDYSLAKVVADTYEGETSPNGVWFRNVRINELGRDGSFYKTNVLIDFEYTETK